MKFRYINFVLNAMLALFGLWLAFDGSWSDRIIGNVLFSLGLILLAAERVIVYVEKGSKEVIKTNKMILTLISTEEYQCLTIDEKIKTIKKVVEDE